MPTKLTLKATEQGTYIAHAEFKDEDGAPVSPATMAWRLTDEYGTVINNRGAVAVPAGTSADIVLSGDDLQALGHKKAKRYLTLIGTYNSDLGNGLPLIDQAEFTLDELAAVDTGDS